MRTHKQHFLSFSRNNFDDADCLQKYISIQTVIGRMINYPFYFYFSHHLSSATPRYFIEWAGGGQPTVRWCHLITISRIIINSNNPRTLDVQSIKWLNGKSSSNIYDHQTNWPNSFPTMIPLLHILNWQIVSCHLYGEIKRTSWF